VSVNAGPTGQFPNTVLTSVTVCVPGTQTCQTIPNVMVDTGSTGLRLLASVLTIALPPVTSPTTGHAYSECTDFADGVTWGAVSAAVSSAVGALLLRSYDSLRVCAMFWLATVAACRTLS